MELLLRSIRQAPFEGVRDTRWLAVRNTFNELKTTTLKTLENWLPDEISDITRSYPPTAQINFLLPDGTRVKSEILFLALDRPDDVKKLKSLEVTGTWLNEASELEKEVLEMAIQRSGRYPSVSKGGPTWSGVLLDYNPVPDDHWLYDLFEIERPTGYTIFRYPPALLKIPNPAYDASKATSAPDSAQESKNPPFIWVGNPDAENVQNLQGGFDYYLRQVPGKDSAWIDVFILGQYGASIAGQAVYKGEWNDKDHVAEIALLPDQYLTLLLGFDWGLNPAVIFGQLSRNGTLCIIDELVPDTATSLEELIDEHLVPLLNEKYRNMKYEGWGDPAGVGRSSLDKRTPFQLINKAGIACRPARTNDFIPRRDAVVSFLLRRRGFLLSPACKVLRKGFGRGYHYERYRTTGELRPHPAKNAFSHPHDALQYLCLGMKHTGTYNNSAVVTAGGGKGTSF
jgi:hypothetical protein